MFDHLLIPLDGSSLSAEVIPYVEQIPSRAVTLLTVNTDDPVRWHEVTPAGEVERVREEPGAPFSIDRIAERLRYQGRTVDVLRKTGDPAEQILAAVAAADLVVMATHGRGGMERAMLGSVADRVVREGSAPTIVVRGQGATARPITRIVVPLDGFAGAEGALPIATRLAAALGLPIDLVLVVGTSAEMRDAAPYMLDQVRRLQRDHFIVSSDIRAGATAESILAHLQPGDLVVMTTRGHGGVRRLVQGSVADQLVRLAPGPVLIQRAAAAPETPTKPDTRPEARRGLGGRPSILLIAATKHGSTREIAQSIAEELEHRGFIVELRAPDDAPNPERYDAAIIGSAVYVGRWRPNAREFIAQYRDQLRAMPVWLFSSGPLGADDLQPKGDPFRLPELMEETGARGHRMFAGRLDKDDLNLGERLLSKAVKAPEGDFRDWPAIWNWADEIAEALAPASAGRPDEAQSSRR